MTLAPTLPVPIVEGGKPLSSVTWHVRTSESHLRFRNFTCRRPRLQFKESTYNLHFILLQVREYRDICTLQISYNTLTVPVSHHYASYQISSYRQSFLVPPEKPVALPALRPARQKIWYINMFMFGGTSACLSYPGTRGFFLSRSLVALRLKTHLQQRLSLLRQQLVQTPSDYTHALLDHAFLRVDNSVEGAMEPIWMPAEQSITNPFSSRMIR